MGKYGKMAKSRRIKSENLVFSLFFQWIVGQNPPQDLRGPQLIILTKYGRISTTPDPFCNDFTFLIFFCNKKLFIFWSIFKVFLICSCFVELRKLRDQSQIVDLVFAVRTVASRASETSKISKWWQNKIPKENRSENKVTTLTLGSKKSKQFTLSIFFG